MRYLHGNQQSRGRPTQAGRCGGSARQSRFSEGSLVASERQVGRSWGVERSGTGCAGGGIVLLRQTPPFIATVLSRRNVANDVTELTLMPVDGQRRAWQPGAHIELHLGRGLIRHYSLCGPQSAVEMRIAALREENGRGGSVIVCDELEPGMEVEVAGPTNRFWLFDAEKYHFVAGGIGITPIISMIERVNSRGRDWTLDYGGRSRASMAYADELVGQYGSRVRLHPLDEIGPIPLSEVLNPAPGTLVYSCGPAGLLNALEEMSTSWPPFILHTERFVNAAPRWNEPADPFVAHFRESGVRVTVPPGMSILDAAMRAGVDIPYTCREGVCGTCEVRVLQGKPRHRDIILSEAERRSGDRMMVCVSGCDSSEIVLEA